MSTELFVYRVLLVMVMFSVLILLTDQASGLAKLGTSAFGSYPRFINFLFVLYYLIQIGLMATFFLTNRL